MGENVVLEKRGRGRPPKVQEAVAPVVPEDTEQKEVFVTQEEVRQSEKESRIAAEQKDQENIVGWRIINNFNHPRTNIRYGKGEPVPQDLTDSEKEFLYRSQKIAKITKEGILIPHKTWIKLNDDAIKRFLQGSPIQIISKVNVTNFDSETLGKMVVSAETHKLDKRIIDALNLKLSQI